MRRFVRSPFLTGCFAVAVATTSFLSATQTAVSGERIVNGNQVAVVTGEMTRRLDDADSIKGEKVFKRRCRSCHTLDQGGADKTGPNLWNIVGRKLGSNKDFRYSADMKTMKTHWGYEELDKFLTKPFKFVPSTRMTFPGLKKQKDRANLIGFLRSKSSDPLPLPSSW